MKKALKVIIYSLLILFLVLATYTLYQFRDRHKGYEVDLHLQSDSAVYLKFGFGKIDISPEDFDTWFDANGDARFNPDDGDYYHDLNGNGRFDPIWLAGFHQNRPASGINDPLWARAMVIDDGQNRIALCVIDMISFGNDEVIATRKLLDGSLNIDHLIIASTHTHSSPDLMGMYGPSTFSRGVNPEYLNQVKKGILIAVEEAVENLEEAYFRLAIDEDSALPLVGDTRDPQVFDAAIRVMQVVSKKNGKTLGTILNWGNHPETLWLGNTLISSDFAHYFREYVENGIHYGDSLIHEGLGGVAIFLNGALGGLMTTHPSIPIKHPFEETVISEESVEKIDYQGMALADIVLKALNDEAKEIHQADLQLRAKSISLPLRNKLFWLGAWTGIFDRGFVKWGHIRSEVVAWSVGPAGFVHLPGELYPEILHGGIESPEGADFGIPPVEVPPITELMPWEFKFFSGMSNDMIGYIVPKSQWDEESPYTYGLESRPYGEINSLGPDTAPILHQATKTILEEMHAKQKK